VASNISTEHFIGMVGWGFLYGMAVSNWEWGNAIAFSALIWIFLPFYMRGNVATMPEFLARRYNPACRTIYATVMLGGLVIAMLGGVMFAGAKALNVLFPQIRCKGASCCWRWQPGFTRFTAVCSRRSGPTSCNTACS
jgi:SSS family solute:Na+ symporter